MPEGVASVAAEEKHHRPADADRRARRDRRHSGGRPRLRRGDQHAGDHRPAVPVRLLRRRRPRHRVPRPGAGRPRGQPQRVASSGRGWPAPAASSTSARTPRRSCSSAPSPPASSRVAVADGKLRILQRRHGARSSSREVEHRTFSGALRVEAAAAGALRHRALRVPAVRRRARADRDRAGHRHRARHPRADGLQAGDRTAPPQLMDAAHLPRRPDGPARAHARDSARRGASPTTPSRTSSSSTSSGSTIRHAAGHRRRPRARSRSKLDADRPQGLRDRQLRQLHDRARAGRRLVRDMVKDLVERYYCGRHPLHDVELPAHEARRRAGASAASRRTSTSRRRRRTNTCATSAPARRGRRAGCETPSAGRPVRGASRLAAQIGESVPCGRPTFDRSGTTQHRDLESIGFRRNPPYCPDSG